MVAWLGLWTRHSATEITFRKNLSISSFLVSGGPPNPFCSWFWSGLPPNPFCSWFWGGSWIFLMPCEPEDKKENPGPRCSHDAAMQCWIFHGVCLLRFWWDAFAVSQEAVQAPCNPGLLCKWWLVESCLLPWSTWHLWMMMSWHKCQKGSGKLLLPKHVGQQSSLLTASELLRQLFPFFVHWSLWQLCTGMLVRFMNQWRVSKPVLSTMHSPTDKQTEDAGVDFQSTPASSVWLFARPALLLLIQGANLKGNTFSLQN